ncbi:S-adenosyl-L-methionine-dependent methyltransferase [Jimgerdemannia flammicorona]|uniref:rRNA adenine N(6)-methyltransferase n=1 Tax=Jimgerdemannia flammicorona TaxID=994334 RepID=A0A433QL73_9FUNG|nr:S-adenosyl-L-methionine-dependent methyltransferase [Jimgerdemannia flammicorona]
MPALPRLPVVRELIKIYGISAKSELGQNFIFDKNITDKIVSSAFISPTDVLVVEVGPGPGLLTRSILDAGARNVVAVEKDARFIPTLTQLTEASEDRLKILHGNMLKIPHTDILNAANISPPSLTSPSPQGNLGDIHIVGNLPFNVASPLLLQFLRMLSQRKGLFGVGARVRMTFMFQKEVGKTLTANIGTEHRGRFSVMAQSLCDVRTIYEVPSKVFFPVPKTPTDEIRCHTFSMSPPCTDTSRIAAEYEMLENVLRYFFTKRRKTIGNILNRLAKRVPATGPLLPALLATGQAYHQAQRPENLTNEQYGEIARWIRKREIEIPLS